MGQAPVRHRVGGSLAACCREATKGRPGDHSSPTRDLRRMTPLERSLALALDRVPRDQPKPPIWTNERVLDTFGLDPQVLVEQALHEVREGRRAGQHK